MRRKISDGQKAAASEAELEERAEPLGPGLDVAMNAAGTDLQRVAEDR